MPPCRGGRLCLLQLLQAVCTQPGTGPACTAGSHMPPRPTAEALRNLFCANACLGLSAEVESRPDLQRQLVQFGARCLVLPEAEQAASVEDDEWCRILAQVAEVLSSVCLRDARIQYETASIGSGNSLLKATGSLAARLHLRSASASFEQAKFVLAFLTLMGSLCSDAVSLAEEGQPVSAQHIAVLVQQVGSPGGLPLLFQLASEVAEAEGIVAQARAAAVLDSSSLGVQCWGSRAGEWGMLLAYWANFLDSLELFDGDHASLPSSADSCRASCQAAEALLRLAPLLPRLPTHEPTAGEDTWRSLAALASAAGGAGRLCRKVLLRSLRWPSRWQPQPCCFSRQDRCPRQKPPSPASMPWSPPASWPMRWRPTSLPAARHGLTPAVVAAAEAATAVHQLAALCSLWVRHH